MKHTPGTWTVSVGYYPRIDADGVAIAKTDCSIFPGPKGWEENGDRAHANARLMAAAKDLARVLKQCLQDLEGTTKEVMHAKSKRTLSLATRQQLREALEKAGVE